MAEENVVADLVAKIGLEPDAQSFAAADKMLEGMAAVAAQLVVAVNAITASLDRMAGVAVRAGATTSEALGVSALTGVVPVGGVVPHPTPAAKATAAEVAGAVAAGETAKAAKAAEEKLGGMAKLSIALGATFASTFAVHKIKDFAMELVHASGAVIGTSERLGLSKSAVQELGFAAKIAETDIGTLETGLKFLQQNSTQAAKGSKADAKAFRDLGVEFKDAHGNLKPTDELLEDVATKIAALPSDAQKTAAAMQIFGRSGAQLLPFLKEGGEGIRELREEAKALGGGLSSEVIEEADEFEDSLTRLDFATLSLKSTIGNLLLPALTHIVEWITKGVAGVRKLWTETKYLQTVMITALTFIAATNARVVAGFIARWTAAAAPFIGLAIVIGLVAIALEDIYQTLTGGRGMLGKWLDEWKGAGATDNVVRNLAAGFDILAKSLGSLSGAWDVAKEAIQGLKDLGNDKESRHEFLQERVSNLKKWGKSPKEIAAAQAELDTFTKQNPTLDGGPAVIQRALGKGMDAGVLRQEMGRASIGSNAVTANQGATVNNVAVTVHAKTDADPKEIAHHAAKATKEALQKQNRNLREAHRGR
jgi:hypothetical protein